MNDSKNDDRPPRRPDTRVVTGGRDPASFHGFVNPPVYHASTRGGVKPIHLGQ